MIGALLRVVLIVVIVAAVAAFFIGYQMADPDPVAGTENAVGTSGYEAPEFGDAREAGGDIAENVAVGVGRAEALAANAAMTAKIKSKMALDDTVRALAIDVDTAGGTVTLSGTVDSEAQRTRAVALARDTEGVAEVVDLLTVR